MCSLVVAALRASALVRCEWHLPRFGGEDGPFLVQRWGEFVAWMAYEASAEVHGRIVMPQPWVEVDAAAALVVRDAPGLMVPC